MVRDSGIFQIAGQISTRWIVNIGETKLFVRDSAKIEKAGVRNGGTLLYDNSFMKIVNGWNWLNTFPKISIIDT